MDTRHLSFVNWAVAARTIPGEMSSGDISVVEPIEGGLLLAVIDGLGHGVEAAKAAAECSQAVRRCASEPIDVVIRECHQALKGTRGVVMTVARIEEESGKMLWLGVGNVEGRIWQAMPGNALNRQAPPLRGGVVGHALPGLSPTSVMLERGDLVVLSTDGLSNDLYQEFRLEGSVSQIAEDIMERYWRGKDDALVLVSRYFGRS